VKREKHSIQLKVFLPFTSIPSTVTLKVELEARGHEIQTHSIRKKDANSCQDRSFSDFFGVVLAYFGCAAASKPTS